MHKLEKVVVSGLFAALLLAVNPLTVKAADEGKAETAATEEESTFGATLDLPVLSAYVWRGQVITDEAVVQPYMVVSKGGFSISYWENFNLDDQATGESDEFSEHDISVSYGTTCPLTGGDISIGVVNYDFPNPSEAADGTPVLFKDTREAFFIFTGSSWPLSPEVSINYDFKEADGFYGNLAIGHTFEATKALSAEVGASVGYADSDYNLYYWGVDDSALNDGNVWLNLPIAACESLTITPGVKYTWLLDSDIEDAAEPFGYKDKEQTVASLTASYVF